jgi:hypothetical protein
MGPNFRLRSVADVLPCPGSALLPRADIKFTAPNVSFGPRGDTRLLSDKNEAAN